MITTAGEHIELEFTPFQRDPPKVKRGMLFQYYTGTEFVSLRVTWARNCKHRTYVKGVVETPEEVSG